MLQPNSVNVESNAPDFCKIVKTLSKVIKDLRGDINSIREEIECIKEQNEFISEEMQKRFTDLSIRILDVTKEIKGIIKEPEEEEPTKYMTITKYKTMSQINNPYMFPDGTEGQELSVKLQEEEFDDLINFEESELENWSFKDESTTD